MSLWGFSHLESLEFRARETFGNATKVAHRSAKEESLMDERTPKYTIANDYDQHGDLSADDDPLTQFLIYFCAIRSDGSGDMGFTLEDFERHISQLGKGTTGKAQ